MSLSDGHELAIDQLKKIESHENNALEILDIKELPGETGFIKIEISISCRGIQVLNDGIPLKQREEMSLFIHSDFPFSVPTIKFNHSDYKNSPHVQWSRSICLYLSKDIDWIPNDGMFGFIERLGAWLERAAANQLDETGQALHPPSTYTGEASEYSICCEKNLPHEIETLSFAKITKMNDSCYEIDSWGIDPRQVSKQDNVAVVIYINSQMPYEYPGTVHSLFDIFKEKGTSILDIYSHFRRIPTSNLKNSPLFFFVCAPMMGIRGGLELKPHIACWEIDNQIVTSLKIIERNQSKKAFSAKMKREEAIDRFFESIWTAQTKWCTVYDNRPEISVRRDNDTTMAIFQNKRICLFGCGALGATVALILARANIKSISLYDNKAVHLGLLSRQPFNRNQCGLNKAYALRDLILAINSQIDVIPNDVDLKNILLSEDNSWTSDIDIFIDCTASNLVHILLEKYNKQNPMKVPSVSMSVDRRLSTGFVVCLDANNPQSLYSAYRKTLIEASKDNELREFAKTFLIQDTKDIFQPIPGCSEPTFRGSCAQTQFFTSQMLYLASCYLSKDSNTSQSFLIYHEGYDSKEIRFEIPSYELINNTLTDYHILIDKNAVKNLKDVIRQNPNKRKETGGLIFGHRNDALKMLWIDFTTNPPKGSKSTVNSFDCGTIGVKELSEKYRKQYFDQTLCIGTWHTHPEALPLPSIIDLKAVAEILIEKEFNKEKTLLLIVQTNKDAIIETIGYIFEKGESSSTKLLMKQI